MSSAMNEKAAITYIMDEVVETLSVISTFTDNAQHFTPPAGSMQQSANTYWKEKEQQARDVKGWDVTGEEGGVLQLSISGALDEPNNTYFGLRADDMRNEDALRKRIRANALRLAGSIEQDGLSKAATHGAFAVTDSAAIGSAGFTLWDALAKADSKMYDLEYNRDSGNCVYLNTTDYLAGGKDLTSSTANYQGNLPTDAYKQGELQRQIAGIGSVNKHNKLPMVTAQTGTVTVAGDQSFAPISSQLSASGSKENFDDRFAVLAVNSSVAVNVGSKFTSPGMFAVSRDGKIQSSDLMTYTVVAKTDSTHMTISPRPYAWDERPVGDGGSGVLTRDESAYANVNTSFNNGSAITWLNTTTGKANIIMAKDSMVLASSPIPATHELFSGMKIEHFEAGGVQGIVGFQGSLGTLTGQCRMAIWSDWQVEKPEEVGIIMGGQA